MATYPLDDVFAELQAAAGRAGYRRTLGLRLIRGEADEAVILCTVSPEFANTQGIVHGGVISGLVDSAAGIAVKLAKGDAQARVATVSLTINFHRPARVGRELRAVGRRISGRGTPCCTVEVHDDEGIHLATGIATLRVKEQIEARLAPPGKPAAPSSSVPALDQSDLDQRDRD